MVCSGAGIPKNEVYNDVRLVILAARIRASRKMTVKGMIIRIEELHGL